MLLLVYQSLAKTFVQSKLSSTELESIYQQFIPAAPPGTSSDKAQQSTSWTIDSFTAFLKSGYNSAFADYLTPPPSAHNPAVSPTTRTWNVYQDMTLPLSSYFICCSHNTYLVGNQLVGTSSVEGYVRALLGGCRSVEMDLYDGPEPGLANNLAITMSNTISTDVGEITEQVEEAVGAAAEVVESAAFLGSTANDSLTPEHRGVTANYKGIIPGEPIVTHGGTLTSSLSARRICEAIERYAFVASPYPVIISGELHCSM
jgi:phosphatidylinositol phospholipase C, delta